MARESNGFTNHSQGVEGDPDQGSRKSPYAGGWWD